MFIQGSFLFKSHSLILCLKVLKSINLYLYSQRRPNRAAVQGLHQNTIIFYTLKVLIILLFISGSAVAAGGADRVCANNLSLLFRTPRATCETAAPTLANHKHTHTTLNTRSSSVNTRSECAPVCVPCACINVNKLRF
jgi:hypothetical protein